MRTRVHTRSETLGSHASRLGRSSFPPGFGAAEFAPRALFGKQLEVYGIYVGSREDFDAMNRALELPGWRAVLSGGLRGRVDWHSSDGSYGTVPGRKSGHMAPRSGHSCR